MHQVDHGGRPARSRQPADDLDEFAGPGAETANLNGQGESEQTGLSQCRYGLMWKTTIHIDCAGVSSSNIKHGLHA